MRPGLPCHHESADDVGSGGDERKQEGFSQRRYLSAVADLHDVSVFHDVVFSFKT